MTHLRHRPSSERTGFVRAAVARAPGSGGRVPGLGGRVPAAPNDDGWDSALLPHPTFPLSPTFPR